MALNSEIARQIEEVRRDKIHGASWLSRRALAIMSLAIERSEAEKVACFIEELKEVGRELGESKPSMASITNCVSRLIYQVSRESGVKDDLAALKDFACSVSSELIRNSEEAFRKVTEQGVGLVENGDRLMTCSYSSTICQSLRISRLRGKDFHVLVAESKFSDKSYGEITTSELTSCGIEAETIPDSTIGDYLSSVNRVLVGADSLLADGSLVNGVPTYTIARAAKGSYVSFYSLCETAKFDTRSYFDQSGETEEGFDRVPPHLITGIITEEGILKPDKIVDYIKEMAGYARILLSNDNSGSC